MKKLAIVVFIIIGCTAPAKVSMSYQDWDGNKDGDIERNEFVQGYFSANFFKRWSHGERSITYDEFLNDAFSFLDKNKDQKLSKDEFNSHINAYYFGTVTNSFDQWDKNSDGLIDKAEFVSQATTSHLPSLWDNDGDKSIDKFEVANGMFDVCDANNDDKVDEREFEKWKANRIADTKAISQQ